MADGSNVHKCDDPECWKQGKAPADIVVPEQVNIALLEKAEKIGVSYEKLVLMILEDYVVGRERIKETVEKMVKEACEKEFDRIAFPILCALEGRQNKKIN